MEEEEEEAEEAEEAAARRGRERWGLREERSLAPMAERILGKRQREEG